MSDMIASLIIGLLVATGAPAHIPLGNATQVRIDINGDLHAVPNPHTTNVSVRVTSRGAPTSYSLGVTRTGSRLTVRIIGPRPAALPFSGASGISFEVSYPARAALDIREYGGNVRVEHPAAAVDLFNALGNVDIQQPRSNVTVECTAGNITITQASGSVDVAADTGNVDADLATPWSGTSIRMQASNGHLRLHVPPTFQGNFDASTGDGHVTNELRSYPHGTPVFLFAQTGDVFVSKH